MEEQMTQQHVQTEERNLDIHSRLGVDLSGERHFAAARSLYTTSTTIQGVHIYSTGLCLLPFDCNNWREPYETTRRFTVEWGKQNPSNGKKARAIKRSCEIIVSNTLYLAANSQLCGGCSALM